MIEQLNEYVKDAKTLGMTKHTIETYTSNLFQFFIHTKVEPGEVDINILVDFLNYLRYEKVVIVGKKKTIGVSNSTVNGHFAALNSYFDYLEFNKIIEINPVPRFRRRYLKNVSKRATGPESTRQLISVPEMALLVYTTEDLLNRAIIMTFAKTGIRRNELMTLDFEDIDLDTGTIHLKPAKKRTNRTVFIDPEGIEIINEYLDNRGPVRSEKLFTKNGRGVTKNEVYGCVVKNAQRLGLHDSNGLLNKKFTPHACRHWFTTHLRKAGMCREFRQTLRGDAIKDAIDIYDHIDLDELREDYLVKIPQLEPVLTCRDARTLTGQQVNASVSL